MSITIGQLAFRISIFILLMGLYVGDGEIRGLFVLIGAIFWVYSIYEDVME